MNEATIGAIYPLFFVIMSICFVMQWHFISALSGDTVLLEYKVITPPRLI